MKANDGMSLSRIATAVIVFGLAVAGCDYIVPPPEDANASAQVLVDNGWAGIVTNVADANGTLHVDLSIVNNTNDWSAMNVAGSSAKVRDSSGQDHDCGTAFVGTAVFVNDGGTFLAPGFVMKGYTSGSMAEPKTQLLYVECKGVTKAAAAKLAITYSYMTGPFNYYVPSKKKQGSMNLDLAKVATDTKYPRADTVKTLVVSKPGEAIGAINNCSVKLSAVTRTDTGFELTWDSANPTDSATQVHIGIPPVIGADGIVYGFYQSPHQADVPITPAGGSAEWKTVARAPKDVTGFYVLTPLETQQQKYFVDHVIDITDK